MDTGDSNLLSGLKVLIIDDEPAALSVTRTMLSSYGAEVIPCLTGAEGLEQLRACAPDVIVCDITMPQLDGYQFIKAVRSLPPNEGRDTPAVAFSVLDKEEAQARAIKAGFQIYLGKPVRLDALIEAVATAAEHGRDRQ